MLKTMLKQHSEGCTITHPRGGKGLLFYIAYGTIHYLICFFSYNIPGSSVREHGIDLALNEAWCWRRQFFLELLPHLLLKLKSLKAKETAVCRSKNDHIAKKLERDVLVLVSVMFLCGNRQVTSFFFPGSHQFFFFISGCLISDLQCCLQNSRIQAGNARGGAKMCNSVFKKASIAEKRKCRVWRKWSIR